MPDKPIVEICVIDYPSSEGICTTTTKDMAAREVALQSLIAMAQRRVPLSQMDKSVCFAPPEWEKVQNYIDRLEEALRTKE
jgi:hypothetical protein